MTLCGPGVGIPSGVDSLLRRITDLERAVRELAPSIAASFTSTIRALPLPVAATNTQARFGLASGWNTYAKVKLHVPEDKTRATVLAIATGAAVDTLTGGITSLVARITIGGQSGTPTPGSKDSGASAVNNIFTTAHTRELGEINGEVISISAEISPNNPTASPPMAGNHVALTVVSIFS